MGSPGFLIEMLVKLTSVLESIKRSGFSNFKCQSLLTHLIGGLLMKIYLLTVKLFNGVTKPPRLDRKYFLQVLVEFDVCFPLFATFD